MFDFLAKKFSSIFNNILGKGSLSEKNIGEAVDKVKDALLEADVPYGVAEAFINSVKEETLGEKLHSSLNPGEYFVKVVNDKLLYFLGGKNFVEFNLQIPSVIMVMGLQGSGKTTFIAKLSNYIIEQASKKGKKRKILVASVDFYRPAAIEQLEILANSLDVDFYRSDETNPIEAAKDIYSYFKKEGYEYLFLDTAGRLQIDEQMMEELKEIDGKLKPKYKILVLDAMTGQESLRVAEAFDKDIKFESVVLTKMDSDTRGGAALAFRYVLQKPIIFVGTGEKIEDLEYFKPDRMASRILGMGDLQSLVEKAEQKIKKSEQERLYKNISGGKITLQDFADQLGMVEKMGSLSQIMEYMPGVGGANIPEGALEKGEVEFKKFKAIISSMTSKERIYPKVLDGSRKQRIAKGAGVSVANVNLLLERFEQSQQFVKLLKRFNRFPKLF